MSESEEDAEQLDDLKDGAFLILVAILATIASGIVLAILVAKWWLS